MVDLKYIHMTGKNLYVCLFSVKDQAQKC